MLELIPDALSRLQLADGRGEPFEVQWGRNLMVFYQLENGRRLLIKVAPEGNPSMAAEADGLAAANEAIPGHVPRLIGYTCCGGIEFLVSEYVECLPLSRSALLARKGHHLRQVLSLAARLPAGSGPACRGDGWDAFSTYLADASSRLGVYVEQRAELLSALPHVAQHGDFALKNLGLRGERVVVFDWEDYGRVALPGFDIAVLVAGIAGYDPSAMLELLSPEHPAADAVARSLAQSALTSAGFRELLPVYLAAFAWLKVRYDAKVRQLALHAADALAQRLA